MSKLSFRARALDVSKPMGIYRSQEIPDLPDFAAINRAVPQMPTGMEKEEECETHLQRAMNAQQTYGHTGALVIPTPEVFTVDSPIYDKLYPSSYKLSKQLIYMQPLLSGLDDDTPEYDLDSDDENWLSRQKLGLDSMQFETMIDRLEKASGHQVIQMNEAKSLLKQDDDVLIAVYDYWLNKRLKLKCTALMPQIKTEKRDGSNSSNPYVAFRRRTEKMQTRKNRKNDEASYEKMLKLKRDLKRAVTLLEMVKKREKLKRESLHLTVEVFEKRVQAGDISGSVVAETLQQLAKQKQQQALANAQSGLFPGHSDRGKHDLSVSSRNGFANSPQNNTQANRDKSKHRKSTSQSRPGGHKRPKDSSLHQNNGTPSILVPQTPLSSLKIGDLVPSTTDIALGSDLMSVTASMLSSEEEEEEVLSSGTEDAADMDFSQEPDGMFTFRRKRNVTYLAPLPLADSVMKDDSPLPLGLFDSKHKFHLTTLQLESDDSDLSSLEDDEDLQMVTSTSSASEATSAPPSSQHPLPSTNPSVNSTSVSLQSNNDSEPVYCSTHTAKIQKVLSNNPHLNKKYKRRNTYYTFIGRRRIGRGGRIIYDRIPSPLE